MTHRWKPSARFWRRAVQIGCLAAFLWLFRRTEYDGFSQIPAASNLLFRVDPLVGASAMLGAKEAIAPLVVPGIALLALTVVLGRFFCGWICPLGTCLDGARRLSPGSPRGISPGKAGAWRKARYFLLFSILSGALVGLPLVGLFDPFSLLVRGLTFAVDPAMAFIVGLPFDWLYRHGPEGVVGVSEAIYSFLKDHILPIRQTTFLLGGISFAILLGIFLLERVERRFWCRSLCPLGALLSLAARTSLLRRKPFKSCKGCLKCAEDCRMGAFGENAQMSPEACNLCMDCVADCPHGMVTFRFQRPLRGSGVAPAPLVASRRLFLGAAGTGLALAAVSKVGGSAFAAAHPRALRPPGAAEDDHAFLDRCVRCGLCMKVCPTNALQPTGLEGGWEALFAPRIVPRIGYCEYNCALCGEVCPTGAIPRLDQAAKHGAVIGKAEFDLSRCLPYARGEPCIVCEEHCPVPDKAIQVREVEVTNIAGKKVALKQPYVKLELCVGCGICEKKCPLQGAAGVRVRHVMDAALTSEMVQVPSK